MHLWYLLNPIDSAQIEVRVVYTFLKLVYDPYNDGTPKSMNQLTSETKRLLEDVKKLQFELVPDATDARDKIDALITVEDLIREFFYLSNNFIDYKRGLV
jgi:hypothetical protein